MPDTIDWYSEDRATFGDRLAFARDVAGLDQKALSERLGVKRGTVARWEDDVDEPRANRLQMLSGLLGVSMRWLLTGVGDGPAADEAPADLAETLTELRALRAEALATAARLARLEKRLRAGPADG
ncbi:MAG: helix-turn-helix domain-containing protein [Hasllibacter sp.]